MLVLLLGLPPVQQFHEYKTAKATAMSPRKSPSQSPRLGHVTDTQLRASAHSLGTWFEPRRNTHERAGEYRPGKGDEEGNVDVSSQ